MRIGWKIRWGMVFVAASLFCGPGILAKAAQAPVAAVVEMPGFVVEQWSAPMVLAVEKLAYVRELPQIKLPGFCNLEKGQFVPVWGQTDTGWYLVDCGGRMGYVRSAAGNVVAQQELWQQQDALAQQQAALAQEAQRQAALAQEAAQQQAVLAQQQQQAAQQPPVAAGIVLIGDSRMVTLKEATEQTLGVCPAAVVAKRGARYEWFHDTGIPQADKIIGNGSRVVINMGVNDLEDVDKYAQDVNYWAAVWSMRGASVYYASVNPVYANSYGMTEERVAFFNSRLQSQLIPQVVWLDSNTYLKQTGVHSNDGLHYQVDTDMNLFHFYMAMIGAM